MAVLCLLRSDGVSAHMFQLYLVTLFTVRYCTVAGMQITVRVPVPSPVRFIHPTALAQSCKVLGSNSFCTHVKTMGLCKNSSFICANA